MMYYDKDIQKTIIKNSIILPNAKLITDFTEQETKQLQQQNKFIIRKTEGTQLIETAQNNIRYAAKFIQAIQDKYKK